VETEAYVGTTDAASHARFGPTDRNRVMWGGPGVAYVYLVYGMYDCLNVVVGPVGSPAAVLVRAVEPIEGVDAMRAARLAHAGERRRAWTAERLAAEAERLARVPDGRVASGPGAVSAAFSVERSDTGTDLCDSRSPLRFEAPAREGDAAAIVATPRIGIDYAVEPWRSIEWRFLDPRSRSVSGAVPRDDRPRRRR
jgi:DNA-3-methyladenine glycosylase